ncbi:MAG TPA: DNA-processing protein DprA [Calditerricola sp.]
MERSETSGLLAVLALVDGVGPRTLFRLVETAGGQPEGLVGGDLAQLCRDARIPPEVAARVREAATPRAVRALLARLARLEVGLLTYWDAAYPSLLAHIADPPPVLFVRGDLKALDAPGLAIVGTRRPTPYGRAAARRLAFDAAGQGWTVVSGLAAGIDGEAHLGALEAGGTTVAVLGCGVDVVYPRQHRRLYERIWREGGLVLSELPPGTPPQKGFFPRRNRIISGLSHGVVVVEAGEKSGSLITADLALEQGREVFAVPGSIFSPESRGPHALIQQGAKLVTGIDDVLSELAGAAGLAATSRADARVQAAAGTGAGRGGRAHDAGSSSETPPEPPFLTALSPEERAVWPHLVRGPVHVDDLVAATGLTPGALHAALLALELRGWVMQLAGGLYVAQETFARRGEKRFAEGQGD